ESKIINPAHYPSNKKQDLTKKEKKEKKVEKIVEGTVVQRKKSLGRKIADTFSGDDARSVGQYLLFEIFVPNMKDLIFDLIRGGAERSLYGTDQGRRPKGSGARRVQYDRMFSGSTRSDLDRPGGVRNMSNK